MKKHKTFLCIFTIALLLTGCSCSSNPPQDPGTPSQTGGETDPVPQPDEHTHTYSSEWKFDEEFHWHPSTCGHDVVSNKEAHNLVRKKTISPTEDSEGEYIDECSVCGYTIKGTIEKLEHTHIPGSPTQTNYVAPTCTKEGSFDEVILCVTCGEVLESHHKTIDALGHDLVHNPEHPATCMEHGETGYDFCTRCGYETEHHDIPPLGHKAEEPVKENLAQATCEENGSYDLVTYCSVCKTEINREHKIIEALGHDLIHHEETNSSCTEHGHYEYDECTRCDYTTYKAKDLLPHNVVLTASVNKGYYPTASKKGKYSYIFRCTECDSKVAASSSKETGDSTNIKLSSKNIVELIKGNSLPFTNTSSKPVEWLVEDTSVLEIQNGIVKAIGVGTSVVWAYNQNLEIACTRVDVIDDELKLSITQTSFYPGDTFEVGFEKFTRGDRSILSWESSNEEVATVDKNGKVSVISTGDVTITAKNTTYGLEDSISFTSKEHFAILKSNVIEVGRDEITYIFESYSRSQIFNWVSDNPTVAKASGGIAVKTFDKYGTATLTATSEYLAEDIVIVVKVVETTLELDKSNYSDCLKVNYILEDNDQSWFVKAEIEMLGLWVPSSSITFFLRFTYQIGTAPEGSHDVTLTVKLNNTISSSEWVAAKAHSTNIYGDYVEPSYQLLSIAGTVSK